MGSALRRIVQAARQPTPRTVRDASPPVVSETVVALASDRDIGSTVCRLTTISCSSTARRVLIIPSDGIGPRAVQAVTAWMSKTSTVSLALPYGMDSRNRQRWTGLAESQGAAVVHLGSHGWERVILSDWAEFLGYVDAPVELGAFDEIVVVRAGTRSIMSAWRDIVHANSAMRARAAGPAGDAALSLVAEARYLWLGKIDHAVTAFDCRDRVAAELVAAAIGRIAEEAGGVEAAGPWEETQVQELVALAAGISIPSQLLTRASGGEPSFDTWSWRLAELIGSRIEMIEGERSHDACR